MRNSTLGLAAAALIGTLLSPAADAATFRVNYVMATGVCQPATPLELGGLRFRPLGIYNNKPNAIYISCSLDTELIGDQDTTDIRIWFDNQGTVTQNVECTIVGGRRGAGASTVSDTLMLASGAESSITFADLNRVSTSFTSFNISCLLPSKVEMGLIRMNEEDVGDGL